MSEIGTGLDRFGATIVPDAPGLWTFRIDAWSDPWATTSHAIEVKLAAGQGPAELANDLELAARLLEEVAARRERKADRPALQGAADALRDAELPLGARVGPALGPEVRALMHEHPVREFVTKGAARQIWVDRERAAFGSWYEFFPRSTGGVDAAMHDTPNVLYYIATAGDGAVKTVGEQMMAHQYGIGFPKGSELTPKVNEALAKLKADGRYDAIYEKWFGAKPAN